MKIKLLEEKVLSQTTIIKSKDENLKNNAAIKKQDEIQIKGLETKVKDLESLINKDQQKEEEIPHIQELHAKLK